MKGARSRSGLVQYNHRWRGIRQLQGFGGRFSQALPNQVKEGLKSSNLINLKTPTLISFLGLLPQQRERCLLRGVSVTNNCLTQSPSITEKYAEDDITTKIVDEASMTPYGEKVIVPDVFSAYVPVEEQKLPGK
jgi:hypothetical protein